MKEKMMANLEQYRAVLEDLMKQRAQLQFKIGEIETAVAALRRLMPEQESIATKDSQSPLPVTFQGKYAGMSNRWAILAYLSEDANGPVTTGQVAEVLQAGGMVTTGKNYAGNISAVLSGMNHDKGEVTSTPEGWVISEKGKDAWIHIKASRERKAHLTQTSSPTVQ
jgi:hypothetical protein